MAKGFMDHVAKILVPEFPGETATWYAKAYLNEAGEQGSSSRTPVESLAATLNKQVKEGREKRIFRKKLNDGLFHYFPSSLSQASDLDRDVIVQVSLSIQEIKDIDNLVSLDKFTTRNSAIKWLIMEGIKANRPLLDKVANTIVQIEHLKKGVDLL